ncbi:DUF3253 domain-containing protein [Qipengyuania nanhaisediminis]|uniref:DUF3253 domain-containing protein n=1 Tax=Qipengyuania nanhaisediminis TaxID=604088 RepID=UPI0038B27C58
MTVSAAKTAILALLDARAARATICPSEAARRVAGVDGDWRHHMEDVHAAVDGLLESGVIALSWKGKRLSRRRGAYRIARRQPAAPDA